MREVTTGRGPTYAPEADVLVYDLDTFGQPTNVVLNGTRLIGVQAIELRSDTNEFNEVTIRLGGTYAVVNPKERSAQDS